MLLFKKIYSWICKIEEVAAGTLLVLILFLIFSAAVARGAGYPLSWAMDMATFLFAWSVFLSADAAMRHGRHVNVDVLVNWLPEKARHYINLLNHLIIAVFLGFLVYYGIKMSILTRLRTFQGIPGFSYMWATLSIPVGSLLLFITTTIKIEQIFAKIRGARR